MMVAGLQPGYMRCTVYGRACFQLADQMCPQLCCRQVLLQLICLFVTVAMVCPSKGHLSICR